MSDELWVLLAVWIFTTIFAMSCGVTMSENSHNDREIRDAAWVILLSPLAIVIIPIALAALPFYLMWQAVKTLWPDVTKS